MTRVIVCGLADFRSVVASERARGNAVRARHTHPQSLQGTRFDGPLDLEAIRAEFDLPDCIETQEHLDGSNALLCLQSGVGVSGGTKPAGWFRRRAAAAWWRRFEERGRPRRVFAERGDRGGGDAV